MDILSSPSRSFVDRQLTARRGRSSAVLGVIVVGFLLAGCGNKGPLVPPQPPAPKASLDPSVHRLTASDERITDATRMRA